MIAPVTCSLPNRLPGGPKLSGQGRVRIRTGSRLFDIYQREHVEEEFFCNYEVNPRYQTWFEAAGLRVSAVGDQGEVRAVELPGNRFFMATLFQPQLSSTEARPHPFVVSFLEAARA